MSTSGFNKSVWHVCLQCKGEDMEVGSKPLERYQEFSDIKTRHQATDVGGKKKTKHTIKKKKKSLYKTMHTPTSRHIKSNC